jgi:hypothetical protein
MEIALKKRPDYVVVDPPSKRLNSDTSQVRLQQCVHMLPSGLYRETGSLKME